MQVQAKKTVRARYSSISMGGHACLREEIPDDKPCTANKTTPHTYPSNPSVLLALKYAPLLDDWPSPAAATMKPSMGNFIWAFATGNTGLITFHSLLMLSEQRASM